MCLAVSAVAGPPAARQPDKIALEKVSDSPATWRYRGESFALESQASEDLTRRFAERLDQMFAAYRRILAPRAAPQQELRIEIYGSSAAYAARVVSLSLPVKNAAFYHAPLNLVVAGSDLMKVGEQLQHVRAEHVAIGKELNRLKRELQNLLKESPSKPVNTYAQRKKTEIAAKEKQMDDCDRKNEALLEEHAGRMLRLLFHESFHAYLENYVYPQPGHDVPRWLNEGLAQIFEHATLDEDRLRIDVPHLASLELIQNDLKSPDPLTLAKILSANHSSFLVPHDEAAGNKTIYAYAWGLAYYLAIIRPAFQGDALDKYVSHDAAALGPIPRFERLVGKPLPEFEKQWRAWLFSQKRGKSIANR
jgi:hypothetical protein